MVNKIRLMVPLFQDQLDKWDPAPCTPENDRWAK